MKNDPIKIVWAVNTDAFDSASVRFRCAYPVAYLSLRGHRNTVVTKLPEASKLIPSNDAIVIVKRMDSSIIAPILEAKEKNLAVFLDICDDIISPDNKSYHRDMGLATLRAIAPYVDALICPSYSMKVRLEGYLLDNVLTKPPVVVIEDCLETEEVRTISGAYWETLTGSHVNSKEAYSANIMKSPSKEGGAKNINLLWFGNWGGPHSNFGLASIIPIIHVLNNYTYRNELKLDIVSNHKDIGGLIVRRAKFNVRYHEWTQEIQDDLIRCADLSIITTGDDQFSTIKSTNRILSSLVAGVPVVVDPDLLSAQEIWPEVSEMPSTLRIVEILNEIREKGSNGFRRNTLLAIKPVLAKYSINSLCDKWLKLLDKHVGHTPHKITDIKMAKIKKVVHFIGEDEDLTAALSIRNHCIKNNMVFSCVTSLNCLYKRKNLFSFFGQHALKPSIIDEGSAKEDESRRLRGADALIANNSSIDIVNGFLKKWADNADIPIISQGKFIYESNIL